MDRLSSTILQPLFASKDALLVQHEDPSQERKPRTRNHGITLRLPTLFVSTFAHTHVLSSAHPATNRAEAHILSADLSRALPHSESSCPRSAKPWVFGASQSIQPIVGPMIPRYFQIERCAQYCNPTFQKESL